MVTPPATTMYRTCPLQPDTNSRLHRDDVYMPISRAESRAKLRGSCAADAALTALGDLYAAIRSPPMAARSSQFKASASGI